MGWNSWDSFGPSIREDEVKANVDVAASRLAKYGWKYMTVDIEWYAPDAHAHGYIPRGRVTLDQYGRFVPAVNRFPSAANGQGFKPLADYVHSKGLKFGIHIMRGIPREAVDKNLPIEGSKYHAADVADKVNVCHWKDMEDTYGVDMSRPGAQDYYDSIARLYASWGVDFVKADDMSRPFRGPEIHALSIALKKTGRPIVLSLSPGPAPIADYAELEADAQMWRISNDFWDRWIDVKAQFDRAHLWEKDAHTGGWPDADMLPLGHIAIRGERGNDRSSLLTHDEQTTLMTLWSIFRSPLIFGGDLATSDAFTFSLLTNPEVIAVDQASKDGHESYRKDGIIAWTAGDASGNGGSTAKYVAVFNTGDTSVPVDIPWKTLGAGDRFAQIRDLWRRQSADSGVADANGIHTQLAPHAALLYKLSGS
jgi:alpha-galactosidase